MTKEIDSRREELEMRRYHVDLRIDDGDDCVRSGEFYYDSPTVARRFVRKQYADWSWGLGLGGDLTAADWKQVWKRGVLYVSIRDEGGRDCSFSASLRDTAQPTEKSEPVWIDYDFTEEAQARFESKAAEQA